MTDTERAALERRIDELCAELGRSQLNRDMWHDRAEDMRNRLSVVQAENAKLRELVTHLHTCLTRPHVYDGTTCPYLTSVGHGVNCNHETCGFKRRMRELGIEINYGTR